MTIFLVLLAATVLSLLGALTFGVASAAAWLYSGHGLTMSLFSVFHYLPRTGWIGLDALLGEYFTENLGLSLLGAGVVAVMATSVFGWLWSRTNP